MSIELLFVLRLVHLGSGVAWLGEVLTVNVVLLPVVFRARTDDQIRLLQTVFPLVFRLATVLGGVAVASGAALLMISTGGDPLSALQRPWGWRILVGGVLGAALFLFHLVQESSAERMLAGRLAAIAPGDAASVRGVLRLLAVAPRVGAVILVATIALMSAAARLP